MRNGSRPSFNIFAIAALFNGSHRVAHFIATMLFFAIASATWWAPKSPTALNDFYAHSAYWIAFLEGGEVPAPPLFYFALGSLTGFTRDRDAIWVGISIILGSAIALRYLASVRILHGWSDRARCDRARQVMGLVGLAGASVMACLPMPGPAGYFEWITPNLPINMWHNSTLICMMPLAVLLFCAGMDFMESNGAEGVPSLFLYSILNVLTKPSFFFCFAPVFVALVFIKFRSPTVRLRAVASIGVGVFTLLALYFYVYHYAPSGGNTGHAIGFFHVWSHYSGSPTWLTIPLATVNSLLFPIAFLAAYPLAFVRDRAIVFAAFLMAVGVMIWIVIYETGAREYDGNMGWQVAACNYLLQVAVLGAFIRNSSADMSRWHLKDFIVAATFGVGVLAGIVYLMKFARTGSL